MSKIQPPSTDCSFLRKLPFLREKNAESTPSSFTYSQFIQGERCRKTIFLKRQSANQSEPIISWNLQSHKNYKSENILAIVSANSDSHISYPILTYTGNINCISSCGETPLFCAVRSNKFKFCEALLQHGAKINVSNYANESILHVALKNGFIDIAKLLTKKGASVNSKDNLEQTPLFLAVKLENYELCHMLLQHGAHVNCKDTKGCTPLHLAAQKSRIDIADLLITYGADMKAKNKNNKTPYDLTKMILTQKNGIETLEKPDAFYTDDINIFKQDGTNKNSLIMTKKIERILEKLDPAKLQETPPPSLRSRISTLFDRIRKRLGFQHKQADTISEHF